MKQYRFIMWTVTFFLAPVIATAGDYASQLANKRLVMKKAEHAGMQFKGKETLLGFAELTQEEPVFEARVRWIEDDLFLATEKGRSSEKCPPRNWLYRVLKVSGQTVTLKEYWTGWPDAKDDVSEYRLAP